MVLQSRQRGFQDPQLSRPQRDQEKKTARVPFRHLKFKSPRESGGHTSVPGLRPVRILQKRDAPIIPSVFTGYQLKRAEETSAQYNPGFDLNILTHDQTTTQCLGEQNLYGK